jgi:hypothetical protein
LSTSFNKLGLRSEVYESVVNGPLKEFGKNAIPTDIQVLNRRLYYLSLRHSRRL